MTKVIRMQLDYKDLLLTGRFVDNEGFALDNAALRAKAYEGGGRLGVVVWNPTAQEQPLSITVAGRTLAEAVTPDGKLPGIPPTIAADSALLLVWE